MAVRSTQAGANQVDVLFVSPSLIEVNTDRGGGIEESSYRIGSQLSRQFRVGIVGPFLDEFVGTTRRNENLLILQVPFPALQRYLPQSNWHLFWIKTIMIPLYCSLLALDLFRILARGVGVVVVHNGPPGLVAATLARMFGSKIIFSEGNTYPWSNPFLDIHKLGPLRRVAYLELSTIGTLLARVADRIRTQSYSISKALVARGIRDGKREFVVYADSIEMDRLLKFYLLHGFHADPEFRSPDGKRRMIRRA